MHDRKLIAPMEIKPEAPDRLDEERNGQQDTGFRDGPASDRGRTPQDGEPGDAEAGLGRVRRRGRLSGS